MASWCPSLFLVCPSGNGADKTCPVTLSRNLKDSEDDMEFLNQNLYLLLLSHKYPTGCLHRAYLQAILLPYTIL